MPMPMYCSNNNPNDTLGGGGCLCLARRGPDTQGPFVLVPSNRMSDLMSPHIVICAPCIEYMAKVVQGEQLSIGEKSPVPIVIPPVVSDAEDDLEI